MQLKDFKDIKTERLVSLDLFRGITMFLLAAESAGLYYSLQETDLGSLLNKLVLQFHHHPWHGFRFWDLIQPFFMYIVGVAMPFSYIFRKQKGLSDSKILAHTFLRCFILFLLGVMLHCGYNKRITWELWNVLTQLSFTILVAFLLMKKPLWLQISASFALILATDILYRWTNIQGYDSAFEMGKNFGSWADMQLMGKLNGGGWVAINAIPTAAHTIWGVVTGIILINNQIRPIQKLILFSAVAIMLLIVGYTLDLTAISPVIKRICTSSFILIAGGWTLLSLAFCYWLADIQKINKPWTVFLLFGMNPIFIYLFNETLGHQWLNDFMKIFVTGFFQIFNLSGNIINILNSIMVIIAEIYILRFLYQKKIFFKI